MENKTLLAETTPQSSKLLSSNLEQPFSLENPSHWIKSGDSPTEIVLAAAILVSVSMGATATVIAATTGLIKALVPVLLQLTDKSSNPDRK